MNILLVYPTFPKSFWSFAYALTIYGRKALLPPLGLLTVGAMLPAEWNKRLVDLNVRALTDDAYYYVAQARANPIENFRLVFNDEFMRTIVGRMDDNADIFRKILDEPAFKAAVMDHYLQRVFEQARSGGLGAADNASAG